MTPLLFLACVLATYACSLIVSKLGGPAGVFRLLRRKARGSVKEGLECPICTGTWVALLLTGYLWWFGHVPTDLVPVYWFAITGGATIVHLLDRF